MRLSRVGKCASGSQCSSLGPDWGDGIDVLEVRLVWISESLHASRSTFGGGVPWCLEKSAFGVAFVRAICDARLTSRIVLRQSIDDRTAEGIYTVPWLDGLVHPNHRLSNLSRNGVLNSVYFGGKASKRQLSSSRIEQIRLDDDR